MNKILKIGLWFVGGLLGLLILILIGLWLFLPLDDIKQMAIEKGEAALGRDLEVESIDLSIWGGLGVKLVDLSVGSPEQFGDLKLLHTENVDVKLQLWELIKGNYVVDRLIVNRPEIMMLKLEDGSNNYTFELDASDMTDSATAERIKNASPEKQAAATVVAFDRMEINDGLMEFQDDSSGTHFLLDRFSLSTALEMPRPDVYRSSGRIKVDTVRFRSAPSVPALNVELAYQAEYDFDQDRLSIGESRATINQIDILITGVINELTGNQLGSLSIRSDELQLAPILALLPADTRAELSSVTIDGKGKVEANLDWQPDGDSTAMNYVGTAELWDVAVTGLETPGELKINKTLLDIETDQARLTLTEASIDNRPLRGYLAIESFDAPVVNADLNGAIDLSLSSQYFPAEFSQALTGLARFDMTISGPIANPAEINYVGRLDITDGSFKAAFLPEPIEAFNLSVSLAPQAIRLESFNVQFVSSDISLSGRINNPFPYLLPFDLENRGQAVQPHAELTITSRAFNVDKLFPETVPGSGALETSGGQVVIDSTTTTIPLPDITASGTVKFDTVIYSEIQFTGIAGKMAVEDRNIRLYDVRGQVYSGTVTGETTINLSDFNQPLYSGQYQAKQIEANEFVSQFSKFDGYLFGKVDLDGSYSAAGWDPDAFLKSLTMSSIGTLSEGTLKTTGKVNQALKQLASQSGATFSDSQVLRNLWTNIRVENGRVHLDDFKSLLPSIGDLTLSGSYGFDETISYNLSVLLNEKMTSQLLSNSQIGQLASLFGGGPKRVSVPIVIDGTIDNPGFKVDLSGAMNNLNPDLKNQGENLLKGWFNK